jgi:hypothetical protein
MSWCVDCVRVVVFNDNYKVAEILTQTVDERVREPSMRCLATTNISLVVYPETPPSNLL